MNKTQMSLNYATLNLKLFTIRKINWKVVMFEFSKFDKSGLKSGSHIRPGPDLARFEKTAGFRPEPGPDMISGATLLSTQGKNRSAKFVINCQTTF